MDDIKNLGYQIKGGSNERLSIFIQQHFPNFNLFQLLEVVENTFTPVASTSIDRIIELDENRLSLKIIYQNQFDAEEDALLFVRTFTNRNNEIQISHDYCVVPENHRGKGLIKIIFQESLKQYENMNASKILVHAGLTSGGYVWAKHGFKAINQKEIISILLKAREQLSTSDFLDVESIYHTYYNRNPNGKNFPIMLWAEMDCMKTVLMGSDWHGELDLNNSRDLNNFKNYVFR